MSGKLYILLSFLIALVLAGGCESRHEVQVKPVEVKPIHITIDVNIRIDRALDDFFGDLDRQSADAPAPVAE